MLSSRLRKMSTYRDGGVQCEFVQLGTEDVAANAVWFGWRLVDAIFNSRDIGLEEIQAGLQLGQGWPELVQLIIGVYSLCSGKEQNKY